MHHRMPVPRVRRGLRRLLTVATATTVALMTSTVVGTVPARAEVATVLPKPLPGPLWFSTAVSAGADAYLFGGVSTSGQPVSTVLRYNFADRDDYDHGVRLPTARSCVGAVWTGTVAYVFGGRNAAGTVLTEILRYDPANQTITTMPTTLPAGRACMGAVWISGAAYLFGGEDTAGNASNQILRYRPDTGTINSVATLYNSQAVTGLAAVSTGTTALLFGGYTPGAGDLNAVTEFTPGSTSATFRTSLPSTRRRAAAVWDPAGNAAYVLGGMRDSGTYLTDIVKYDRAANSVSTRSTALPQGRAIAAYAWQGTQAFLFGGEGSGAAHFADVVRYHPGNDPPTAFANVAGSDHTAFVDANGSSDLDGWIVSYSWDWGDGTPNGSGFNANHTYARYGAYPIVLTVTDNLGASASYADWFVTSNYPPVATFTASLNDHTVSVDAGASYDPDGNVAGYRWNWGDGTAESTGRTAAHVYAKAGTYTVRLTVTDNGGATAQTTRTVSTANYAPVAAFTTSVSHVALSVDASPSSDPDGTISAYAWDWGDGSSGSGKTATHSYTAGGTYTVRLTVTDNFNATATAAKSVPLQQNAPAACYTVTVSVVSVTANGGCSSDPDGDPLTYQWTWGDGSANSTGVSASHGYPCTGGNSTYTLRLTVSDGLGGTGFYESGVTTNNPDGDGDGLVRCREDAQGTLDTDRDFDDDGLDDTEESTFWSTVNPSIDRNAVFCKGTDCAYPNPTVRNVYVEVDWMAGHALTAAEATKVRNAFANAPMNTDADPNNNVVFTLDTGQFGGGGSVVPLDQFITFGGDFQSYKTAHFASIRSGIFRYGLFACSADGEPGTVGQGEAPGDDFVVYDCAANMTDPDAQAKEVMHELGHNLLGLFVRDLAACAAETNAAGQLFTVHHNDDLGHFADVYADCDPDGTGPALPDGVNDVSAHPVGTPTDVMNQGGPTGKTVFTYATATWNALKLDYGIDGTVMSDACRTESYQSYESVPPVVRETLPGPLRGVLFTASQSHTTSCTP